MTTITNNGPSFSEFSSYVLHFDLAYCYAEVSRQYRFGDLEAAIRMVAHVDAITAELDSRSS